MIFVDLKGRIGNQLFIYAAAENIRNKRGKNEKIIFFDKDIIDRSWYNALADYHLKNVEFVHEKKQIPFITRIQIYLACLFYHFCKNREDRLERYKYEQKHQSIINRVGVVACYNGVVKIEKLWSGPVYMKGYFQSEHYFNEISSTIRGVVTSASSNLIQKEYVKEICNRNAVCISVKVEHNAGDPQYDVCGHDYYKKAIEKICNKVKDPLFFICSDNVQYVLDNLIDSDKFEYVCQEKGLSVIDSLNIMGMCKHFIIGNTTFGWWAQYLSDNSNKIVIAPKPWTRIDDSEYIYCKGWETIDVSDYIAETNQSKKIESCRDYLLS